MILYKNSTGTRDFLATQLGRSVMARENKSTVLIVDDEPEILEVLNQALADEGYRTYQARNGQEALRITHEYPVDVVLTDYQMPDIDGNELLRKLKKLDDDLVLIMLTGFGSVSHAVRTVQAGAFDYLEKPVEFDKLKQTVRRAVDLKSSLDQTILWRSHLSGSIDGKLIGEARSLKKVMSIVRKISCSHTTPVLICGETGTGKGLLAKAIHSMSPRSEEPFIEVNCTALPETLFESELFGHEKGAFTDAKAQKKGLFELADGGTLFLDEVGHIPLHLQVKLLKVVEEQQFRRVGGEKTIDVDVRIITATNEDLDVAVGNGRFREDLYYRLNVISLTMPPLRQRVGDIFMIAQYYVERFSGEFGKNIKGLGEDTEKVFKSYPWPGNIRELRNVIERAVLLTDDKLIPVKALPERIIDYHEISLDSLDTPRLEDVEKKHFTEVLEKCRGNQSKASEILGVSRRTIYEKLKRYDIDPRDFKPRRR